MTRNPFNRVIEAVRFVAARPRLRSATTTALTVAPDAVRAILYLETTMLLTRLSADSTDTMPCIPPTRFADPRIEHCGDTDKQLIDAALSKLNDLIHRTATSLGLYPDHRLLQTSFAKLVGQRDQLEQHLARIAVSV